MLQNVIFDTIYSHIISLMRGIGIDSEKACNLPWKNHKKNKIIALFFEGIHTAYTSYIYFSRFSKNNNK